MTPRTGEKRGFAAAPDLHGPVLEALRPSIRATLSASVLGNLVNVSGDEIAQCSTRVRANAMC